MVWKPKKTPKGKPPNVDSSVKVPGKWLSENPREEYFNLIRKKAKKQSGE